MAQSQANTVQATVKSTIRVRMSFYDVNGGAADPSTLELNIRPPNSPPQTYTYALAQITRVGTGIYDYLLTLSLPGLWHYHYVANISGLLTSAEGQILVIPSPVLN